MSGPAPPTAATPWQEYLAAAGALQAVHRGHAEASAAATHAASAARAELVRVSARLEQQRARLDGAAGAIGEAPAPADVASLVTGGPAAVHAALLRAHQLLAETDSALADRPGPARRRLRRPPRLRRLRLLPRLRRLRRLRRPPQVRNR